MTDAKLGNKQRNDSHSAVNPFANPASGLAAATAVGVAMTAQALDLWFGVVSGMAKASKEMLEPGSSGVSREPAAYAPSEKPAVLKAKSATRTIVADIERTVQDVAEVTVGMLGGKSADQVEEAKVAPQPAVVAKVVPFEAPAVSSRSAKAAVTPAEEKPVAEAAVPEDQPVSAKAESTESLAGETSPVAASAKVEQAAELPASHLSKVRSAIMPEDFRQPKSIDKPDEPDDLKAISGVGPRLEKVLNGLGVWTFDQVAAWSPEEIAWVDDYLGLSGRIARDGWAAQADGHAKGMKAAG